MNKRKQKLTLFDGQKSVDIWNGDEGWTILGGANDTKEGDYYKFIPTLFRAVQLRSYAVSTMPYQLMKGKTTVYDSSANWKNRVGFLPNPTVTLQLIESALVLFGSCYLFKDKSIAAVKKLRYHLPNSITPIINKKTGELETLDRPVDGVTKHFAPSDYVYFWLPDPYIEVGPAKNFPAQAAFNACGLLYNLDEFAIGYAQRGLIKAMLLMVKGMPVEAERQKLEDYWNRFISGVKNAGKAKIFNADAITPTVVGEGFRDLENVTIGEEKREDIAIATGIPMSILFANAANYATSQQDELNFLSKTIIPDCLFIESILNEQLFDPLGLRWEFMPETLDALQEDEVARAGSLQQLTDAGVPLLMAMDILGYELTDEQRAELEKAEADKEAKAEEMAKLLAQKPEPLPPGEQEQLDAQQAENAPAPSQSKEQKREEGQYEKKALRALKAGESADVEFIADYIPPARMASIKAMLATAKTADEVKAAFVMHDEPEYNQTAEQILEGIRLGVKALSQKG